MTAWYNEIDPNAAAWLRNLIAAGHIAPGIVDERSIEDVVPTELMGYTQCHFFAGVGVWSYALRGAGWADDRKIWTGSCPCQPFSAAGKGTGFDDERHLWPAFQHLISQCKPAVVFGEQVASKDADPWIDLVHADLEALGYAFGAVAFPSAGVGAPHIRDRTYWVADSKGDGRANGAEIGGSRRQVFASSAKVIGTGDCHPLDRLADTQQHHRGPQAAPAHHGQPQAVGPTDRAGGRGIPPSWLADSNGHGCESRGEVRPVRQKHDPEYGGAACGLDDPKGIRPGLCDTTHVGPTNAQIDVSANAGHRQLDGSPGQRIAAPPPGPTNGIWRAADWLGCRDGRWRPVEPGTFPLAAGLPRGMGQMQPELRRLAEMAGLDAESLARAKSYRTVGLRGYGNAINSQAAQAFIECVMESA